MVSMLARQLSNLLASFELFDADCAAFESRAVLLRVKFDDRKRVEFLSRKSSFASLFVFASELYDRRNLKS